MPDSDESRLLSVVCHYVKLMSITWILGLIRSSDWAQGIDLHLLSITEIAQSQFNAQYKQYDMFDWRNIVVLCASVAWGWNWRYPTKI